MWFSSAQFPLGAIAQELETVLFVLSEIRLSDHVVPTQDLV